MEISDLKIFSAVAQSGSITLAANKLHRVPSNVSTRIQKLESSLNQTLFIRENNRLRISSAGESLLEYATKIIALAEQAVLQFDEPTPRGTLRIGSMEAVAATYLSQYLTPFHQQWPDVKLNVKTLHTDGLVSDVINGDIDLALVANPKDYPGLNTRLVIKEPMVLVSSVNTTQLKNMNGPIKLLGFAQGCYYRKCLMAWADSQNLCYDMHEIQSYHSLLNCISAGMGIGIVPKSLLDQYHNKSNIQTHNLPTELKYTQTYLIWRNDNHAASLKAFIGLFKKKPSI